jgi:hypothetical protein
LLVAAAVFSLVALPAVAVAADTQSTPQLVLVDDDGTFQRTATSGGDETVDITLGNPTTADITLFAAAGDEKSCVPAKSKTAVDRLTVPALRQMAVTVTFHNCTKESGNISFELDNADTGDNLLGGASLTATPSTTPAHPWKPLWAFVVAGVLGGLLVLAAWGTLTDKPRFKDPLPGLSTTWKFQDSWASNATVVAGLFAGLFGATDVTKALLGDQSKQVLTVVTVTVALAAGLATLAPMVLQGFRDTDTSLATALGVVVAATFTLGATVGEVWVITFTVWNDTTTLHHLWIWFAAGAGTLLVGWYAWRSTQQSLTAGKTTPAPQQTQTSTTSGLRNAMVEILKKMHAVGGLADAITAEGLDTAHEQLGPETAAEQAVVQTVSVVTPPMSRPSPIL